MKDHPMMMPRDPPPEIDVTRPALPKVQACRPEDRAMLATPEGRALIEAATKALTESAAPETDLLLGLIAAYKYSYDAQGNMCVQTVTAAELYNDSAAQAPIRQASPAPDGNLAATPVAADQFKAGDRVMWHYVSGSREWLRGIYSAAYSSNIVCRRPTDAELALHWPSAGAQSSAATEE